MDGRRSQGSQISPGHAVEVVTVEIWRLFEDEGGVELQDLEKDDDGGLENVCRTFVYDEFFVPLAVVNSINPHVKELGAHWEQKVRTGLERDLSVSFFGVDFEEVHTL